MAGSGGYVHSSGIPALRMPTKYVVSNRARIFGTPQYPEFPYPTQGAPATFRRAMLKKRPSGFSLCASVRSAAPRSVSPLRP
jgi:hypothetical protein